jgi:hypothetical protein
VATPTDKGFPPEMELTLQAPTSQAVVITGVKVDVLERTAVPGSGTVVEDPACGGTLTARPFDVDLTRSPAKVRAAASGDGTVVDFPLKVSAGDPEQIGLNLDPGDWRVRFTVEVGWIAEGEPGSKVLDNNGRGYQVMGMGGLPSYTEPVPEQ